MPLDVIRVDVGKALDELLEYYRASKKPVSIAVSYDLRSAVSAGILVKVLRDLRMDFSIHTLPEVTLREREKIISFGTQLSDCNSCMFFLEGSSEVAYASGSNYIIKYPVLPIGTAKLLEEYTLVSKELKYLIASAIYSSYTPRLLSREMRKEDAEFLASMREEGLITMRKTLKVIGWDYMSPADAVRYSIDALIPKYFQEEVEGGVSEDEVIRELGDSKEEAEGIAYIINEPWFYRDITEGSYALEFLADLQGLEAVISSVATPSLILWATLEFRESLRKLKEALKTARGGGITPAGKFKSVELDEFYPPTVLTKVLRGLKLVGPQEVVGVRCGEHLHLPLLLLAPNLRRELLSRGAVVKGGVLLLKGGG